MRRRSFLATPAAMGLPAFAAPAGTSQQVIARGDGIPLTPGEYTTLLAKLGPNIKPDSYSLGGTVEALEQAMAKDLGKEYAVWMPTGTLANHLALRLLAGGPRRVIVPAESHLFNDCGDCAQTLSNLHLIPLASGKATFTLDEVEKAVRQADEGRVPIPVGALLVESPVRRRTGEMFDFAEMKRICAWARDHKVGTHLDGARLYLASAYTGISVAEYSAPFDTVYISMYKYFNAASGAILAGPKAQLENLYHTRRMFGGGVVHSWTSAAVALHYQNGFNERMRSAVKTSEAVIATLAKDANFEIERVTNGSNIFKMRVRGVNAPVYQQRLELAGVSVSAPVNEWFPVQVNETWNFRSVTEIGESFRKALG